ncbi:AAA family ATPase [Plantactinospora sp. S1510]|uniref:AAA family ATPase n=1 Tax=Plantactinospora alkalitolerans TaxID=2789879 RepID=A0ABS0GR84_9ACTN|nr:helix-turn-helix transcriptional regulator [Plantactinospora alkalitolerans]MBF9128695.1 AAA family ATPase [Plantactinospora alkalitolerans]
MLRGRAADQAAIDALLADGHDGHSGALVLRGEPGIGKTALIEYAASRADGMTVIRGIGIETEAEIAFGSLHLLLLPVLDRLDLLPGPQAAALKSAFGRGPAAPHDQMLAGLAVLSLLAAVADERPLLCLVDDAQWLDQASARALSFAARRLQAEGVVLIFGARAEFEGSGLPQRRLLGLDRPTSAQLLTDHAPGLATLVRDRLIEESAGNPLALLELPRSTDSLSYYHSPLPLPRRIQETYEQRIAELEAPAQTMLLLAAAEGTGDLGVVLRAATTLGVEMEMLGRAERAGFLRVADAGVSFVHPLMRAAAFQHGTFDQRLAVHRALADALTDQPERQAWQLAAAATGPDDRAADALALAAEWARERNGYAATAAALERSAELTADPVVRAERLVAAATAAADVGLGGRARSLVERCARLTGRWHDAVATATEGLQIAADIGQPHRAGYLEGILAWVAAVHGDDERCLGYAASCHDRFGKNGIANGLAWAQWSRAMLELGGGRLAEALGRLDEAVRGPVRHQIQAVYFAPDQIEAAVRLGQPERAVEPLARFEAWAEASRLDWADAVLHRCRALLEADAETAHELYRSALALHADSGRPWETARTYLLLGERLRRDRRIVEARDQLRHALEIFERLSAAPWAGRARAELRAAGETSTAPTPPDLLAALSPQELQIVRLAASGLTNPEIGAQLFLSAKTISYHLYRAFPKLNVTSRTQLARLDLAG